MFIVKLKESKIELKSTTPNECALMFYYTPKHRYENST